MKFSMCSVQRPLNIFIVTGITVHGCGQSKVTFLRLLCTLHPCCTEKLLCNELHYTALYCTELNFTAMHRTALFSISLPCPALQSTPLHTTTRSAIQYYQFGNMS